MDAAVSRVELVPSRRTLLQRCKRRGEARRRIAAWVNWKGQLEGSTATSRCALSTTAGSRNNARRQGGDKDKDKLPCKELMPVRPRMAAAGAGYVLE